jgi:hypothetical protein
MRYMRVRDWRLRVGNLSVVLCCLALLTAAGCTVAASRGTPPSPTAEVLPADARALAYGATTAEVLRNPEIADKARALFGPDWMPGTPGGGQMLVPGAVVYFEQGGPVRMLRIGGIDYVAVSGCVPGRCDSRQALLLIEVGGERLFARVDEGGFVHYYGYGGEGVMRDTAQVIADSGFRALYPPGSRYRRASS